MGRGRGHFAIVDIERLSVRFADQHKSAAADISRLGINDRQRQSDSDGRIYRVAAFLHYVGPDLRSQRVLRRHHRMPPADRIGRRRKNRKLNEENRNYKQARKQGP